MFPKIWVRDKNIIRSVFPLFQMCIFRKIYFVIVSTMLVSLLVTIMTLVIAVDGFRSGPPLSACGDMFPKGHGVPAQNSTAPYQILVSMNLYQPKEKVRCKYQLNFFINCRI